MTILERYPSITAALHTYAEEVGDGWQAELARDWARACSEHVDHQTYQLLHILRNHPKYGTRWLAEYTV